MLGSRSLFFVTLTLITALLLPMTPGAFAVHDTGLFQLDGDALNGGPVDDWEDVYANTSSAGETLFIGASEEAPDNDTTYFTGGGSKDINDISEWRWTAGSSPDKNEITDAFGALYTDETGTYLYFGADRFARNGDSGVGFWFLQEEIGLSPDGNFTGNHTVGDIFVVSEFTNGGVVDTINVWKWDPANASGGDNVVLITTGATCLEATAGDTACARVNLEETSSPWPYDPKVGSTGTFQPGAFFEAGIDLGEFFGGDVCFTSFLAETRSSQELTATLKDFALGDLGNCVEPKANPNIEIVKTPDGGTVNASDPFAWNLTIINSDPNPFDEEEIGAAINATVNDTVPSSLTILDVSASAANATCSTDGQFVSCVFPWIGPGEDEFMEIRVQATTSQCGRITNTGNVTTEVEPDSPPGQTTDEDTGYIGVLCPDLSIAKTPDGTEIDDGSPFNWTLNVTNHGTGTAYNVTLNDSVPSSLTIQAVTLEACSFDGQEVGCDVGDLAPGAWFEANVTVFAPVDTCGAVTNTVTTAATNEPSANLTDNTDDGDVHIQCPDLAVNKTPDQTEIDDGSAFHWTLYVNNTGNGTAHDVYLNDTIPVGLTIESVSPSEACSVTNQTVSCEVGSLSGGASFSATITVHADAGICGPIDNTASAESSNEPTDDVALNTDTGSVYIQCPDLTVTKTPGNGTVDDGSSFDWTVNVTNSGNGTAHGVYLNDTVPSSLTIESVSPSANCTVTSQAVSCDVGSLSPGGGFEATISVHANVGECGRITNTGTAEALNELSAAIGDNSDTGSVYIDCPDVTVAKTPDSRTEIDDGSSFDWTLRVTNVGNGTAHGVNASDTLPAGLVYEANATTQGSCEDAGQVVTCELGTIAPGDSVWINITVHADVGVCGPISNTATVEAGNEPASVTGNNSDTGSVYIQCPDLRVTKTPDGANVDDGSSFEWIVYVNNTGNGTAHGVYLNDTIPSGLTIESVSPVQDCSFTGQNITCDIGTLPPGTSGSLTARVHADIGVCGRITNTGTAEALNELSAAIGDNSDTGSVYIDCPDVTVAKTPGNGTVDDGTSFDWTLQVTNVGNGTAHGVNASDTLPAGLVYEANSTSQGACETTSQLVDCQLGTLAPGDSVWINITVHAEVGTCGRVTNTASVEAGNEPASATGNNDDDGDVAIQCPDLTLEKTPDSGDQLAGSTFDWTLNVTNNGTGTAANVWVNDTLPTGLTYRADDAGCSNSGQDVTCSLGDLSPGSSAWINITVYAELDACGPITNTGVASADNEASGNLTDNTDTGAVRITCPDIELAKTSNATAGQVDVNGTFNWTLTVNNTGSGTAVNTTVQDTIPGGLEILGASEGCEVDGQNVTCDAGNLSAGGSTRFSIEVQTSLDDCGLQSNSGAVSADNEATNATGDNTAVETVYVVCADVGVDKTADVGANSTAIDLNGTLVFLINVTSFGPDAAENVTLADDLPTISGNWSVGGPNATDCAISNGTLACNFGDLAANETRLIHLMGTTGSIEDCGDITNVVRVFARLDTDLTDNRDSATIHVTCADVSVAKTAVDDPIDLGHTRAFNLTVTSHGPDAAENVTLSDSLPALNGTWTVSGQNATACEVNGTELACGFDTMEPGATANITVTAQTSRLDPGDCGDHENVATVAARLDIDLRNNEDNASVHVTCADVTVTKAGPALVFADEHLNYTLVVESLGPDAAENVTLNDTLPPMNESWTVTRDDDGVCSIDNGTLLCTWEELGAGENRTVTVSVITCDEDCGLVANAAHVSARLDLNHSNNVSNEVVTLIDCGFCPHTQGFWRTHPDQWDAQYLRLGDMTYTRDELLEIFWTPVQGDASLALAHQLIASQLSIASGASPGPVHAEILEAHEWLATFDGKLPYDARQGPAAENMTRLADHLDRYNNGEFTPDCEAIASSGRAVFNGNRDDATTWAPTHPEPDGYDELGLPFFVILTTTAEEEILLASPGGGGGGGGGGASSGAPGQVKKAGDDEGGGEPLGEGTGGPPAAADHAPGHAGDVTATGGFSPPGQDALASGVEDPGQAPAADHADQDAELPPSSGVQANLLPVQVLVVTLLFAALEARRRHR